ncbi:putative uncharacterized protein K02A2.6-like [Daphnia sinensis]|uniref:Reverse transcriptase domain-containing protein n=1 Tax=Daphnia sinensis TaxID=1820382 RepID=A0AAD5Q2R4_9CRUS|nr:putative uncharacterized protein K02A2.6-like [Daphnia sinensis]
MYVQINTYLCFLWMCYLLEHYTNNKAPPTHDVTRLGGGGRSLKVALRGVRNLPQKSETFERFKFVSRKQAVDETFDKYLLALKGLIFSCNYDTQRDSLLRDQIVVGIIDNDTREQLLSQSTLDFKKAVEICCARESARKHAVQMQPGTVGSQTQMLVNSLNASKRPASAPKSQTNREGGQISSCRYCGGQHFRGKCPAYGKSCAKCGMANHFAKVCEQPIQQQTHQGGSRQVNVQEFTISSICDVNSDDSWFVIVHIDGAPVKFKVDTGAQCNVLPKQVFDKVVRIKQLKPGPRVTTYNRQPVHVVGQQQIDVVFNNISYSISCVVADEVDIPVLGLPSCKVLNVDKLTDSIQITKAKSEPSPHQETSVTNLVNKYESVFKGIGKLPVEHRIQIHSCSSSAPSSPMVVARNSNGDIRICLDPADLSVAIKRQHYQVPSAQEIFARIGKAKYFSTLDATAGFLQVPLAAESTSLTTMATPFGRYKFLRLPFGLSLSPEAYQQMMVDLFGDLLGVEVYFDDFFVWGETIEEHNSQLEALFQRCVKVNLKLNKRKCKFLQPELKFIGHIFGNQTLKPDPEKISAIVSFQRPQCKQDIQRFLGMVNYLAKFCSSLSETVAPLRLLLKSDVEWQWDANSDQILKKVKSVMANLPVLRLFDPALPVLLSVDASPVGVGAVLLQSGQPLEFAS